MSFSSDNDVQGYGWSADGAYFAFGVRQPGEQKRALYFWSSATQQFITSSAALQVLHLPDETFDGYEMINWSPAGHNLAFIAPGSRGSAQLQIINPDGSDNHMFNLMQRITYPALDWSSDGKYLTFSNNPEYGTHANTNWQVDVFSTDGSSYRDLSHIVSNYTDKDHPELTWTDDDKLVFMEAPRDRIYDSTNPFIGQLKLFDAVSQHLSLIADNVAVFTFDKPSKHFAKIDWAGFGGMVDIITGKRYPLITESTGISGWIELSPDGHFALTEVSAGSQTLTQLVNIETGERYQVPNFTAAIWSPDRTMLLFYDLFQQFPVTVIRTDGTVLYERQLSDMYNAPQWIPCNTIS